MGSPATAWCAAPVVRPDAQRPILREVAPHGAPLHRRTRRSIISGCYTFEMSTSKDAAYSLQLQDRDLALLRGLFECRIMTITHAANIHFDGHWDYAKKRLQVLKAAKLIDVRPRLVNEPGIHFLAKDGFILLREHGILSEYPYFSMPALARRANVSDRTIRHELAVMDVKAAFHTAVRTSPTFSITEFGTWPRLYEFEARHPARGTVIVKPDGFIRIREKPEGTEHSFFLEVDLSTEKLDIIVSRAAAYLDNYRSGGFAVRNGLSRDQYWQYPFRVLIVCKSPERRDNIAARLLKNTPPILTHAMLTTIAESIENPLGRIWICPSRYRDSGGQKELIG